MYAVEELSWPKSAFSEYFSSFFLLQFAVVQSQQSQNMLTTSDCLNLDMRSWFKHILFMTEHDKGLGRAKKLCLGLSMRSCLHKAILLD